MPSAMLIIERRITVRTKSYAPDIQDAPMASQSDYGTELYESTFEEMLKNRNHLGLLEDTNPETGELWSKFPQTHSMVSIINGAMRLSRR